MATSRFTGSALALLFALPVYSCWHAAGIPLWIKLLSATLLTVAIANPGWSLLIVIGVLPLATALQGGSIPFYSFTTYFTRGAVSTLPAPFSSAETAELMVVSVLAGAYARLAWARAHPPTVLGWPAAVLGTTVAVSAIVALYGTQLGTAFGSEYVRDLRHHWRESYFGDQSVFLPLHAAAPWIEGLALAVLAERLLRARPSIRPAMVRMLFAGAMASAVFSWNRLFEVWLSGRLSSNLIAHWRFSPLYTDLNAAGSLYAIWLVAATWLALQTRRWWTWLATLLLTLALWVTHSRSAEAGAIVGFAAVWLVTRRASRWQVGLALGLATCLAVALAVRSPVTEAQSSAAISMTVRWQMTKIGLTMAKAHPVFGIGLGEFRAGSRALIPERLMEVFPQTRNGENAHNNFLQILAELGLVGLGAFLWLLVSAGRSFVSSIRAGSRDAALAGLAAGLVAFLVSCLSGHPLLIPEVLFCFCAVLGVVVGLGVPEGAPGNMIRRAGAVLMLLIAASAPIRLWQMRQSIDLDQTVIGASTHVAEQDGIRYRTIRPHSRWYVSSSIRDVQVPLRAADGSTTPCYVRIEVNGVSANTTEVPRGAWMQLDLPLGGSARPRSRALDFFVLSSGCDVQVGQLKIRD